MQLATVSAHADANEILAWLRMSKHPPRAVFVTHGEPDAADALRIRVRRELGWTAHEPCYLQRVDLR